MRRATWMFPCLVACTSATPPDRVALQGSADSPVEQPIRPPAATPVCEPGQTRACYAGPEATAGVGRCKAGVETCDGRPASWGACVGAVVPAAAEDCATPDDDDCDGRSDDCAETTVPFATAFTSEHELWLSHWGGGLGVVDGARLWVVEPGGRVVDVFEGGPTGLADEGDELTTLEIGGAWPGALLRSYQTGFTRAGHVLEQERWGGSMFEAVENSDDHLSWSHRMPIPWRDGHAIALQERSSNYETMEALDDSTLEYGAIEAAEQRKLKRQVERLLARAKPRLVIVAAEEVEAREAAFELFSVGEEEDEAGEGEEATEATLAEDAAKAEVTGTTPQADPTPAEVAEPEAPALPKPPPLPEVPSSFVVLSDGTVVIFARSDLWSWKPKQRRWSPIERRGSVPWSSGVTLHVGPEGDLLLSECVAEDTPGSLWRRSGSSWSAVPLPTPACPQEIAVAPDRTWWLVSGDRLWQRRGGEAEAWTRVALPAPWKPYQVVVFDGLVWVVAEGEGGEGEGEGEDEKSSAVFVNRPVPTPRVLPPPEE